MRKRSVACLCLLLIAVMLLSACDGIGGDPAFTAVPMIPSEPNPFDVTPEDFDLEEYLPEDFDPEDYIPEDYAFEDYEDDEFDDDDGYFEMGSALLDNPGVAAGGPGLPVAQEPSPTPHQVPRLTPDPSETPIAVDPLDKPTQKPLDLSYVKYESAPMGISFDRPAGWKEDNPADSNVQFMEPETAARGGYRAMLTVRVVHRGSRQDTSQAKALLTEVLEEMALNTMWVDFTSDPSSSTASLGNANGHHAYYRAVFNGIPLRGRIIVVARGNALYMVRLTSTAEFYSLYEDIYRRVRETWSFI